MTEQRCEMCFKAKSVSPAQSGLAVLVCRGCFYEIDRVLGFLDLAASHQEGLQAVMADLGAESPVLTPQTPLEGSENGVKPVKPVRTPAKT